MGKSVAGQEINSSEAVAEAVVSFARNTFGQEKFAILGNSFGGMIARYLVADFGHQILGLALLCPVAVADHEQRCVTAKSVVQSDNFLLASLDSRDAADYEETAVIQSAENWFRFRDSVLPGLRAFDQAVVDRISGRYAFSVEPEDRSPKFHGPSVMIMGRQDHVVGFRDQIALADHYMQGTIAVLDRAGHNAHLDQPAMVENLLSEWLNRMESSVRGQ